MAMPPLLVATCVFVIELPNSNFIHQQYEITIPVVGQMILRLPHRRREKEPVCCCSLFFNDL
jgi:hypothetical protein